MSPPRTAVVVGVGGIGRAVAVRLAEGGYRRLALVYRSDDAAATEAVAAVTAAGAEATALRADLTTVDGVATLDAWVRAQESVDAFVYCAAYRSLSSALTHDPDEWGRVMGAGVEGFLRAVEVVAPALGPGGRIVAVSGLSGIRAYSTQHLRMGVAKAALQHAVRYLALELAPRGVTANAVAFGAVLTPGVAEDLDPAQYEAFITSAALRIPLGRVPQPEEVVGVIGFLASPESGWLTGQVLVVDGGETLR